MTTSRTLTAFGIADIVVGIAVWASTGNAAVGIAIILVGIGILVVPALRAQRPSDAQDALDNEKADQQRQEGETAAEAQNLADRPPPTGA